MKDNYEKLLSSIENAYESGVTLSEAERLAAQALFIMDELSKQLLVKDLNARTRKQGVKAIRSAIRSEFAKQFDKKPTESQMDDAVNLSEIVSTEEKAFNKAEVDRDGIERQYSIAKEAHLFFRGVARGTVG